MGDQEKQTAEVMENRALAFAPNMPDGSAWPRISIVTPNYNYAHYVGDTLYSVVSQGYPNLEYIVIDDGSTDESYREILKYKPWLAHCEQQSNMGQARTLNKGFAMSNGEIMAWLNSDDKHMPWTLAVVAEIFRAFPDVEWITGTPTVWDSQGRNIAVIPSARKNIYSYGLGRYEWIQQESVFWRRSLWERAGGHINADYKFQIDCELWTRFFQLAELWHVDTCLGGYRYHSVTRSSQNMESTHREAKQAIATLACKFDKRILRDLGLLKWMGKLQFADRVFNIHALFRRVFRSLARRTAYKRIAWAGEIGKWRKGEVPFDLFE